MIGSASPSVLSELNGTDWLLDSGARGQPRCASDERSGDWPRLLRGAATTTRPSIWLCLARARGGFLRHPFCFLQGLVRLLVVPALILVLRAEIGHQCRGGWHHAGGRLLHLLLVPNEDRDGE